MASCHRPFHLLRRLFVPANRIVGLEIPSWGKLETETVGIKTSYYEAKPATVLLQYINAARQTWHYGEHEER